MKKVSGAFCLLLCLLQLTNAVNPQYFVNTDPYNDCFKQSAHPEDCTMTGKLRMHIPIRHGRQDPLFARMQRVIGMLKQPRIGRSDPLMAENENAKVYNGDRDTWTHVAPDFAEQSSGIEEEHEKNLENYVSTRGRGSMSPWAFFLITPSFQNTDRSVDSLLSPLGHKVQTLHDD